MKTTYTTAEIQAQARRVFAPLEDLATMTSATEDERGAEWLDDAIDALKAVARIGEIYD